MRSMPLLACAIAIVVSLGAQQSLAAIYKCKRPDGTVAFQQRPCQDAPSQRITVDVSGPKSEIEAELAKKRTLEQIQEAIEAQRNLRAAKLGVDRATLDQMEGINPRGLEDLRITEWTQHPSATGQYLIVTGNVVNEGTQPVEFIKVIINATGDYGKLVDSQRVYIQPTPLYPGDRGRFEAWFKRSLNIRNFNVRLSR